jgi:hypothetical protein
MLLALLIQQTIDLQPPGWNIAETIIMHCMPLEQLGTHEQVYTCRHRS